MPLTYVATTPLYSLYRDSDGSPVQLLHRTYAVPRAVSRIVPANAFVERPYRVWDSNVSTADLNMAMSLCDGDSDTLRETLEALGLSSDEVETCQDCGSLYWQEDGRADRCEPCGEEYYCCDRCEEYAHCDDTSSVGDAVLCDYCASRLTGNCTVCGDRYWDCDGPCCEDDQDRHVCPAPHPMFAIRNNGNEPLKADTRATVTLPGGIIDGEGLTRIRKYLYGQNLPVAVTDLLETVGNDATSKNGSYAKRLSRAVWKACAVKLSAEVMSEVGNIAASHSASVDYAIETTRDLDRPARDFFHTDSCWWNSYAHSRCTLSLSGGFGVRTFSADDEVSGRFWVLPLDASGNATHDTEDAASFVVFNAYGLDTLAAARIMSYMTGWTYRKVRVGVPDSAMYVNRDGNGDPFGYLIAPEPITQTSVRPRLSHCNER